MYRQQMYVSNTASSGDTPSGATIVSLINGQLGQTTWQTGGSSSGLTAVANIAALTAISEGGLTDGDVRWVEGFATMNDGGQGVFVWDADNTATDVAGMIESPDTSDGTGRWIRQYSGPVSVLWTGAKCNGSTDDTAAIQAAIDFAGSGGSVYLPGTASYYRVTSTLVIPTKQALYGDRGYTRTRVIGISISGAIIATNTSWTDSAKNAIRISDITFQGDCTYGLRILNAPKSIVERCDFQCNATSDQLYIGGSFQSVINDCIFWTDPSWTTRSAIWCDSKSHAVTITNPQTSMGANTSNIIVITNEEEATGSEVPANVSIIQAAIQGAAVGIYVKNARAVNIIGGYSESTLEPIKVGTASNTIRGMTIQGMRITGTASQVAAIQLIRAVGVHISGITFDNYANAPFLIFTDIRQVVLSGNCSSAGFASADWTSLIEKDSSADAESVVHVYDADYSNGMIMPATYNASYPNRHYIMVVGTDGTWSSTAWTPTTAS